MKKVNKNTRAPQEGKVIQCPECGDVKRVYHFSWSAVTCANGCGCDGMINKEDWIVV